MAQQACEGIGRVSSTRCRQLSTKSSAAEIARNSPGTNRIVKQLLSTAEDRGSRSDSLFIERTMPYGMPKDSRDRMSGRKDKKKG